MDQENIVLVCVRRVIACFAVIAAGMSVVQAAPALTRTAIAVGHSSIHTVFLMPNGTAAASGNSFFAAPRMPSNDFNGNGKADIVWRNVNGSITFWTMRGLNRIARAELAGPGALRVIR